MSILKNRLIQWLLALNVLVLLYWGGVFAQGARAESQKREEQRQEFRSLLTNNGGMSTQDARAFQARGEKLHHDKKMSNQDLLSILNDINGTLPGSRARYTLEGSKLKLVFSIGHLLEVKSYTRDQEKLIARTLPPYADPNSATDPAQRKILDGIYALIKKLAQRFKDPEAKAELLRGLS